MIQNVMTPSHPDWQQFVKLLNGSTGCNFHQDDGGVIRWDCTAKTDKPHARRLLAEHFPDVDIEASCAYFEQHGGYCDCEILFNVNP